MTYQKLMKKLAKMYSLKPDLVSKGVIYNLSFYDGYYIVVALTYCYNKKRTRIAIAPNLRINSSNKIVPANDDGSFSQSFDEYVSFDNSSFEAIQKHIEKLIKRKKELDIELKLNELAV